MNEEEIIEICKNMLLMPDCWEMQKEYNGKLDFIGSIEGNEAIQGLLDLYNKEKEKNKKLGEELEESRISFREQVKIVNNYFAMNKVIDLMAKDIWESDDWTTCKAIKSSEDCYADTLADGKFCGKDCIKEYYFKVAKGEEYKNKYCGGED